MKDKRWKILFALCGMMMVLGCSPYQFDQERYEELVKDDSPVPETDSNHDWMMTTTKTLVVDPSGVTDVNLIRIFTDNPAVTESAEIVGGAYPSGDSKIVMNISYPIRLETLYAAAIDSEGYYTIASFKPASSSSVDFTNPIVKHEKMSYHYVPQTFAYLFEEEYPKPGDYDYNDIVLRISMELSGKREVRFNVQLAAVGGEKQMGAAIRLVGYKYEEIESVKTVDNASFNIGAAGEIPEMSSSIIKEKDLLLKSMYGEAVLNLFADAHWATGDKVVGDNGMIVRKRYNVSYEKSDEYGTFTPREITYIVTFKDELDVSSLSLDALDTFIIEGYNSNLYEVHMHQYATAEVLYQQSPSDAHNLPWAFCVPYDKFRWPRHGVTIGSRKQGARGGAYHTFEHSFGEWAEDKDEAKDWYQYPDNDETYYK